MRSSLVFMTPSKAMKLVSRSWTRYRHGSFQSSTIMQKFLACWAIQAACGCAVQPAIHTRLVIPDERGGLMPPVAVR